LIRHPLIIAPIGAQRQALLTERLPFWLSASASFVLCSTHGMTLSTSIDGQSGFPAASVFSFSAISRSAR